MATLRDDAIAAYQTVRASWVTKGKERLRPVFTPNGASTPKLDPIGKTEDVHADRDAGLLVLHTVDGSDLFFAVYPDKPGEPVRMVEPAEGGGWTGYGDTGLEGPIVTDLDDVGAVLVKGTV